MTIHYRFTLRTQFNVHFYQKIDGLWIEMTENVPSVIQDAVITLFTNTVILKRLLEYVTTVLKRSVAWENGGLCFDIFTRGSVPHYRDPDYYCYRKFVDTLDEYESNPINTTLILNDKEYMYRVSKKQVDLMSIGKAHDIPLDPRVPLW